MRAEAWVGVAASWIFQPVIVDAEVMGHLVDHGDCNLVEEFLARLAEPLEGPLKDENAVREGAEPRFITVGQREPLIESKQAWVLTGGWLGFNEDGHVAQLRQ